MGKEEQAAADGEFASGYNDLPTETPAESAKPVVEVKEGPKVEAKEKDAPENKELTNAEVKPEEKPDPLKDVQARMDKIQASYDKLAGNLGGLQRNFTQFQENLATAQAATKGIEDAPSKAAIKRAAEDPAEWASLKAEYPDWALATERLLESRMPTFDADAFERKVNDAIEGKAKVIQDRIIDASLNTVLPKWREEVNSEAYATWIGAQPDDIKSLAMSSDIGDAARLLRLFDASRNAKPIAPEPAPEPKKDESAARAKRLSAAVTPRGTGGHAAGNSDNDEFLAGYSG